MLVDMDSDEAIDNIISEERIRKSSLEELNLLNIFWQNRIAKEISTVSDILYLASYEHIYQQVMMGGKIKEPSIANYAKAMNQKKVLDSMIRYSYNHMVDYEKGTYDEEYTREIPKKRIQYTEMGGKEKRNLAKDINSFEEWFYIQKECYGQKDNLIYQLITELNENHNLKNWGVSLEEEQGENMVITVDYPGYNLPCMFHVNRELVKNALRGMKQKSILPIYEGDKDRNISIVPNRKMEIGCNLLFPITKEQKRYLKAKSRELKKMFLDSTKDSAYSMSYQQYKLIDHMIAIAEGEYPEHLKKSRFENNRVIRIRGARRYIDMQTSEIYQKNENGKLEPIQDGR